VIPETAVHLNPFSANMGKVITRVAMAEVLDIVLRDAPARLVQSKRHRYEGCRPAAPGVP